jgi:transposase
LSWDGRSRSWASGPGLAGAPRLRTIRARDLSALWDEVARAKKRFGLPEDAGVYSRDEAGRAGCWRHRGLTTYGIHNSVVDPASIEVKGRGHRKTDRLDSGKLLTMPIRYHNGGPKVWSVVHVPSVDAEDRRH